MSVLFKDLLIGVALVCLMLAFTSLTQAGKTAPAEFKIPDNQSGEVSKFESPDDKGTT